MDSSSDIRENIDVSQDPELSNQQIQIGSDVNPGDDPRIMQVQGESAAPALTQIRISDKKSNPEVKPENSSQNQEQENQPNPQEDSNENENNKEKENPIVAKVNVVKVDKIDTLDEPLKDTIMRDLERIYFKCKHVLIPNPKFSDQKKIEIQNWDLWGPLIICLVLCCILSFKDSQTTAASTFTVLFGFLVFGSLAISLNCYFLEIRFGICQSACLIGYCILPFVIFSLINCFIPTRKLWFVRLILIILAIVWSCFSSLGFVSSLAPKEKKFIVLYPFILFYIALGIFAM